MKWRLVYLGERDPYEHPCYYEAFQTAMMRGLIGNSIYITQLSESIVLFGRRGDSRVKHDYCLEHGIPLIRILISSSSALFFDKSQFFCLAVCRSELPADVETTRFQRGVADTLNALGLKATMRSNDVLIDGKKVSSIAPPLPPGVRTIRFNLINDFDFDTAEKAIVPKHNMRETMTTLKAKLGREITSEELIDALRVGFETVLDAEFDVEYELTEAEKVIVAGLREKYTSESWIKYGKWSPVKDYWRPK